MRGRGAALAVVGLALAGPVARGQSDPASFLLPPVSSASDSSPVPSDRPPPAAKLTLVRESAPVSAAVVERVYKADKPADPPLRDDGLLDYLKDSRRTRRTTVDRDRDRDRDDRDRDPPRRRDSWAFGDRVKDIFDTDKSRGWFKSDHAFDGMVSPLSNPFLFEDPRSLTEVRPIVIYQNVPGGQPNFGGGNLWFVGTQGRVALTDRFSLTVHKLGFTATNPSGGSAYGHEFGFSELWVGPKVTVIRDEQNGTLLAVGGTFQIPLGQDKVFQNTGKLTVSPYATLAQPLLKTQLGTLNSMVNGGYSFSTNRDRSDYFWVSGHLDYDIGNAHRFYPLIEANWFQYTTNGQARFLAGEGRDLINFGGQAKGSNLLTGTVGGRVKLTRNTEFGAGYELPLLGNRDFFKGRFTVDFIWRY